MKWTLLWILLFIVAAYQLGYEDGLRAERNAVSMRGAERAVQAALVEVALEQCEADLSRVVMAPPLPATFGTWLALTQEFRAEVCRGFGKHRGPVALFASNLGTPTP